MVGAEREAWDDVGDALSAQDGPVALVLGQVAQGGGGCSHHRVVAVVEKLGKHIETVGCANDIADIHRPLQRKKYIQLQSNI